MRQAIKDGHAIRFPAQAPEYSARRDEDLARQGGFPHTPIQSPQDAGNREIRMSGQTPDVRGMLHPMARTVPSHLRNNADLGPRDHPRRTVQRIGRRVRAVCSGPHVKLP